MLSMAGAVAQLLVKLLAYLERAADFCPSWMTKSFMYFWYLVFVHFLNFLNKLIVFAEGVVSCAINYQVSTPRTLKLAYLT